MAKLSDAEIPSLIFAETAAASIATPAADRKRLFLDTDGSFKEKDQTGTVVALGGGGGGSTWTQSINESGASIANFTSISGTWASDGTVITQTALDATFKRLRYTARVATALLILEAEMQVNTAGTDRIAGLIAGFGGANGTNGLNARINQSGSLQLQIDGVGALHSVATTISINIWYKVRMVIAGNVFTVYLDGALAGGANAAGWTGAGLPDLQSLYIGLMAYQSAAKFRNIKAWTPTLPA